MQRPAMHVFSFSSVLDQTSNESASSLGRTANSLYCTTAVVRVCYEPSPAYPRPPCPLYPVGPSQRLYT
jgi:hypothetical protein